MSYNSLNLNQYLWEYQIEHHGFFNVPMSRTLLNFLDMSWTCPIPSRPWICSVPISVVKSPAWSDLRPKSSWTDKISSRTGPDCCDLNLQVGPMQAKPDRTAG